jgi:hypothetical protein
VKENLTVDLPPTDVTKPITQSREKLDRLCNGGFSKIKPAALIRKCLNKTCSKFRLREHLPDALRIPNNLKERNASFLLFLSFSLAQSKGTKKININWRQTERISFWSIAMSIQ